MNIKITKEHHDYLSGFDYKEVVFGSHLYGTNTVDSDKDCIRMIHDVRYKMKFPYISEYLPDTNFLQYDDKENNTQYIWVTKKQYWSSLFNGDGHIISDTLLFNDKVLVEARLRLTRTYKNIKCYLGLVKRDLKLFVKKDKKKFHVLKGLYIAECLINNQLPELEHIQKLSNMSKLNGLVFEHQVEKLEELKKLLEEKYKANDILMYPKFDTDYKFIQIVLDNNNLKEIKYN